MMMNEKLSLMDFFSKEYSRIEIPKIQRDYAQGRENESEVADRFLNKIFECLKENKDLELDFIYGSVDKNNVVYLLDGQQRVTTLFLLHWYIALREDIFNEEIKECLKKFTYSTRVSSREFCQNIIDNIKNIKEYYDNKIVENKKLSNIITNFYWFTNENDPTIKAMLNMIDKIDEKYNKIVKDNNSIELFGNLEKIQFYFLPLEDFKLTDEIYLKMNARGKSLTSFENFKALLEDFLKDKIDSDILQQYKIKIDTSWVNFIWILIKDYKKVDDLFMKLFSFIFEMLYYSQIEIVEDTRKLQIEKSNLDFFELFFSHKGDKEKKEYINKLKANSIEKEEYEKTILKENINFIINIFDILSELGKDNLENLFNSIFYYNKSENKDPYDKICTFNNNLNVFNNDDNLFEFFKDIEKRILIFSVFKILNYEYSKKVKNIDNIRNKYFNKLRLIRNLLYNTDNLYDNIYYQMKLIDKIITEDEFEIIKIQLSNKKDSIKNTLFTKDLIKSEKKKLEKLNKNDENINKNIYACENNIFLQGNIDFLLDNISDKNIVDVVNYMFTEDGFNNENGNYLIHRAMLSFIDIENIIKGCKEYEYKYNIYIEYIFKNYQLWDNRQADKERFINFIKAISKKINNKNIKENIEKSVKENCQNIIDNYEKYVKDENDFRYLLIKDATYENNNITNLFHYISGTIKRKGNRGYYLYRNNTKQSIWDIPLSTKVHTMFAKFLKKHTDFKLYYYDGNNNNNIITDDDKSRILMYPNNDFLYCYEWVTLAKEIKIAGEEVLVGFTTDGYYLECGLRKKIPYDDEKRTRKVLSKIEERKINLKKYDKCDNNFYWYYFDICDNISLLEKEYKILKSVIDAFPTK
ncbi:DUF262 domain-containing protein [Brachyspira pilosicoli]|uniref:DUF262 domain-containing protein n=1 Tax=Brachyspira pilosicoli TaxID=52584 RepID=UPI0030051F4B